VTTIERALHVLIHDVRTPLGVAQGYLRMLREDRLGSPEERLRAITQAQQALDHVARLCPEAATLEKGYVRDIEYFAMRGIVRPGITGWAQVNQGHVTELDDVYIKLQYDFYYIKNVSAWLDLLIALKTLGVMVNFRGAK